MLACEPRSPATSPTGHPGASWQRCQVHFARNLLGLVGAKHRPRLGEERRGIFGAATVPQARTTAHAGAQAWQASHPPVAAKLATEGEDCLACLGFPAASRRRIRTTNGLARFHQERKRRTRVVRIFPTRAALRRLVSALAMEQRDEWVSGRRYLDLEPRREERPQPLAQAAA